MERKDYVIDIIKTRIQQMANEQNATFGEYKGQKHSIYRIPAFIKENNKNAYKPKVVSIGPYHHDDLSLKPMEEHKQYALSLFLKRFDKPIESYIKALMESEVLQSLKDSYTQLDDERWQDETKFVELMIVDGCFIIEVLMNFISYIAPDDPTINELQGSRQHEHDRHPIFSRQGMLNAMPSITLDMLVLENQLPMLVLYKLMAVGSGSGIEAERLVNSFIFLTCLLYHLPATTKFEDTVRIKYRKYLHVLDFFERVMTGYEPGEGIVISTQVPRAKEYHSDLVHYITSSIVNVKTPSALELQKAGIHIKAGENQSITNISFNKEQRTLILPLLRVSGTTETIYLNLMAFERLHIGGINHVTSFICFMNNIIDREEDIAVLKKCGVITNSMASNEEAASLFESMAKHTQIDPRVQLFNVNNELNDYYGKRSTKIVLMFSDFREKYFRSPWSGISVGAALQLFALAFTQTVYTVYPYYHPRK